MPIPDLFAPFALSDAARSYFDEVPGELDAILAGMSIKRVGDPEHDVGRAVVYLTGPDAGFTTGCTITVDGGRSFFS